MIRHKNHPLRKVTNHVPVLAPSDLAFDAGIAANVGGYWCAPLVETDHEDGCGGFDVVLP